MFALTHVIRAYEMIKGTKMGITEARQEAWCLMLVTSQREFPPVIKKDYATKTIEGVIVAAFRLEDKDAEQAFGGKMLPILSAVDPMAQKLMKEAHIAANFTYHPIHRTLTEV